MRPSVRGRAPLGGGQLFGAQQTETWNIFIASDSPAAKVPGARANDGSKNTVPYCTGREAWYLLVFTE